MKKVLKSLKPKRGVAHVLHIGLNVILPVLIYVFIRIDIVPLALALVVMSKWRMFAVKPRHWPANIRANGIDLLVGVAVVIFMANSGTQMWQVIWAAVYAIWLLFVKPRSDVLSVSAQALIGQFAGLTALLLAFGEVSTLWLVLGVWVIAYITARHFLTSFDEPLSRLFSHLWAFYSASLAWVLSHWLLFYGSIAQLTLLLTIVGFGLATLYYLDETDKLSAFYRRQVLFIMITVITIVILLADWQDKTI
jgi:hypothetical protein